MGVTELFLQIIQGGGGLTPVQLQTQQLCNLFYKSCIFNKYTTADKCLFKVIILIVNRLHVSRSCDVCMCIAQIRTI